MITVDLSKATTVWYYDSLNEHGRTRVLRDMRRVPEFDRERHLQALVRDAYLSKKIGDISGSTIDVPAGRIIVKFKWALFSRDLSRIMQSVILHDGVAYHFLTLRSDSRTEGNDPAYSDTVVSFLSAIFVPKSKCPQL